MASSIPLVVFDLDGTLADTAGDLIATLNVILARDDVAPLAFAQARAMVGAGARALIDRGYASAGRSLDPQRREQLFRAFLDHYEAHLCDQSHLFPGVVGALDALEADGFGLAVCTNKIEATAVRLLDALGIGGRFRAICGQDTFPMCKPAAGALLLTIERAGGDAARGIMVGDSVTDVATARAAGLPVIAVDFGYSDVPVADLGPDRVISNFDTLPQAVRSVANFLK